MRTARLALLARRAAGAHPAGANGADDLVRTEPRSRGDWHGGSPFFHSIENANYPARLTPQAIGGPTQTMWMPSCGQLIEPGHRGGVCRYMLRSHDNAGSVP